MGCLRNGLGGTRGPRGRDLWTKGGRAWLSPHRAPGKKPAGSASASGGSGLLTQPCRSTSPSCGILIQNKCAYSE